MPVTDASGARGHGVDRLAFSHGLGGYADRSRRRIGSHNGIRRESVMEASIEPAAANQDRPSLGVLLAVTLYAAAVYLPFLGEMYAEVAFALSTST